MFTLIGFLIVVASVLALFSYVGSASESENRNTDILHILRRMKLAIGVVEGGTGSFFRQVKYKLSHVVSRRPISSVWVKWLFGKRHII